jgi:hypothetical protein
MLQWSEKTTMKKGVSHYAISPIPVHVGALAYV